MTRADDALLRALKALAAALESLGQPAMIIGGIAVIARGVPRQTIDIDATSRDKGAVCAPLLAGLPSGVDIENGELRRRAACRHLHY